jgi:hypothetical protein
MIFIVTIYSREDISTYHVDSSFTLIDLPTNSIYNNSRVVNRLDEMIKPDGMTNPLDKNLIKALYTERNLIKALHTERYFVLGRFNGTLIVIFNDSIPYIPGVGSVADIPIRVNLEEVVATYKIENRDNKISSILSEIPIGGADCTSKLRNE